MFKHIKIMALVSLLGHSLFIILVVLQHFLRTDLSPHTHYISEYAVGTYGGLQTIAFFTLGIASLFLTIGLFAHLKTAILSIVTLFLWCIGVFLIAIFPTDLPESISTKTGNTHVFAAQLAFISLGFSMILWGFNFKKNTDWQKLSSLSWGFGIASMLILMALILSPISIKGLVQRALFIWDLSWLLLISQQLYRNAAPITNKGYLWIVFSLLIFYACLLPIYAFTPVKNPDKPELLDKNEGLFYKIDDGKNLFVYNYQPIEQYKATIYLIAGITGINHTKEKDIIDILSHGENRVVVIHPRGTGYSDGRRGDSDNFMDFIHDFTEIISNDTDYKSKQHKIYLFGHSMSTAVLMNIADSLTALSGAILVNPPYLQKKAKGMSPSVGQYIKYACYAIFAKHKPIVNMAGDPSNIENEEDRSEAESRANDSLLVKYFSMYYMMETQKLLRSMPDLAQKAHYPLLLIYGLKDNIVDKKGCDEIFKQWKNEHKKYVLIENGAHGKSTVLLAKDTIISWLKNVENSSADFKSTDE